jgi:hypothetical protein
MFVIGSHSAQRRVLGRLMEATISYRTVVVVTFIAGGTMLIVSLFYFAAASDGGTGKADWVQVAMFFLAVIVAAALRFPDRYFVRDSHATSTGTATDGAAVEMPTTPSQPGLADEGS